MASSGKGHMGHYSKEGKDYAGSIRMMSQWQKAVDTEPHLHYHLHYHLTRRKRYQAEGDVESIKALMAAGPTTSQPSTSQPSTALRQIHKG